MPSKLPPYSALKKHFPALAADKVKALIGGNVDADYITNCCAIRMSRALNGAGAPIPKSYPGMLTVSGADGKRYALRVKELRVYLRATYGAPQLSVRGVAVADSFRGKSGIIRVSRLTLKGDALDMASEVTVLDIPVQREQCCHVGGSLAFDMIGCGSRLRDRVSWL